MCVTSEQKGRCGDWRAEGAENGVGRTENLVLADMGKIHVVHSKCAN